MAAYAEALAAWSADPRFTLNITLFNRPPVHPQVNQVVGDFTTLVLLEAGAAPDQPFEDRAVRLQEQLWSDLEHRRVSGVSILRELARSQPGRALMPVVFTSALGTGELSPDDLLSVGRLQQAISQTPQVYLDHVVFEVGGGLYWSWDAVEALFPEGMLDAMHGAYQALLGRLAGGDEAWRAPPMAAPEAHLRLQEAMNATAGPLPRERLESGFFRQADARPDALAVVSGSTRLTYGELRGRAGAVAAAVAGVIVAQEGVGARLTSDAQSGPGRLEW
jgi:pyochelin synthetase